MKLPAQLRVRKARLNISPPGVLALLYAVLIAAGALLLKLPVSVTSPISWSDALFTSASAVTVTGLAVVDTGTAFTSFGQAIILVLIQLGGLGLMTFAVLLLSMLGLSVGVPHRTFLREDLNQTSVNEVIKLVWTISKVVFICEGIGTLLLAIVFVPEYGWRQGLWSALFHAVSAFNNAGFSLYADSLTQWATHPLINIVIPMLFIIGGIGYSVLADLSHVRGWKRLTLHSKLMLAGSGALIAFSVPMFAALEWSNPGTLGQFASTSDKLVVSWFQAVTTRTAGFNSVDIGALHDSTSLMFISLMLIGGGSTSTAGGIKVTTFVVLLLATIAFFKHRDTLHAFGRSLGVGEVMKVLALTVITLLLVMLGMFTVSISHDGHFLDLAFEVASALGTVGLSRGATSELDEVGRAVIIFLMFVGRVGPLTLGFFLTAKAVSRLHYPAAKVHIG
ncbi:MAG: TrkH family potassium uptake protein [Alphaproteobacteria bacterium]|nr:TrkH family potassium uptake protein [Alphaproteobacteria bacterium]